MAERNGIVSMPEVPQVEWQAGRFGGRDQDFGRAAGSVSVGLRREVISPGKQSGPRHAHMTEEEVFVVLRGRERSCGARCAWRWDPVTWRPFPL